MTTTSAIAHAMTARGLSTAEAAALLGISTEYLAAILDKKVRIKAYVAVRLEVHFDLSAQKILLDQAFVELYKARTAYAREVQP